MGLSVKQEAHTTDVDVGHSAVHWLGDNFGYLTLIGFIIIGALIILRKKIKRYFE